MITGGNGINKKSSSSSRLHSGKVTLMSFPEFWSVTVTVKSSNSLDSVSSTSSGTPNGYTSDRLAFQNSRHLTWTLWALNPAQITQWFDFDATEHN